MAITIFEVRPEMEFEKESVIVSVFNKHAKSCISVKAAVDFCINNKIVSMCYCEEYQVEDGQYESICTISMQEIIDFIEAKRKTPFYLTEI